MNEILNQMICDYNVAKMLEAKNRVYGSAEMIARYEAQAYIVSTYIDMISKEAMIKIEVYSEEQVFFDNELNEVRRDVKQIRIAH